MLGTRSVLNLEVRGFYKSLTTFNNKIKQIIRRNEIPPTLFLQCFESEIVLGFWIRDVPPLTLVILDP